MVSALAYQLILSAFVTLPEVISAQELKAALADSALAFGGV